MENDVHYGSDEKNMAILSAYTSLVMVLTRSKVIPRDLLVAQMMETRKHMAFSGQGAAVPAFDAIIEMVRAMPMPD